MGNRYLLISPCRDEADFMRQTLDTVVAQSVRPAKWVIVDDGSTDATPEILAEYAAKHDWIRVVTRKDLFYVLIPTLTPVTKFQFIMTR